MLTKTETKRKQTYLSDEEKHQVAVFCIEKGCAVPKYNNEGKLEWFWRVNKNISAEEFSKDFFPITSYHVQGSVEWYGRVSPLFDRPIVIPPVQSEVEMDVLKINEKKLKGDIDDLKAKIKSLEAQYVTEINRNAIYKAALNNLIRALPKSLLADLSK